MNTILELLDESSLAIVAGGADGWPDEGDVYVLDYCDHYGAAVWSNGRFVEFDADEYPEL